MKRLAILAAFFLVSQACYRKEYALFNDPAASPYGFQEKSSPAVLEELATFAALDTAGTSAEKGLVVLSQPGRAWLKAENPPQISIQKKTNKVKKLSEQKAKPLFHGKINDPQPRPSRGLGIASLVLGAAGLLLLIPTLITMQLFGVAFAGVLLGITGLALVVVRIFRLKKSPEAPSEANGEDAATIGVVLSTTAIVGGLMVLMIVALATLFSGF